MLSRRSFILSGTAVSGGLVLGYGYVSLDDGDATLKFGQNGQKATPLNAWLKITPDNTIICGIHRAEMGQGITTTLAMLLAEELDADWDDVRFEFTPVDRDYYNFGMLQNGQPLGDPDASWQAATGTWAMRQLFNAIGMSMTIASSSTVDAWDTLRPAGATARQMLIKAAAREWGADAGQLTTDKGYVIDPLNERRLSYGELAEQASREKPPADITLKDPAAYRFVGHNPPRLDTPMKVRGEARFGIDVELPNLRYATVVHSPVTGTEVAAFNTHGAETLPGVIAVVKAGKPGAEQAVAVVAENSWHALQAARKIEITPAAASSKLASSESLREQHQRALNAEPSTRFSDDENIEQVLDQSTVIEAEYAVPILAHACMEPMNCTAFYDGETLKIWSPTQAHSIARDIAAVQSGLDKSQVTLHTTFLGGGFGRRAEMDFMEQAVSVAMQLPGQPIKLFWSREQDIRHDTYRPAASCRIKGTLNESQQVAALDVMLVTQSVVASYEIRTPTPRGAEAETDKSVIEAANPPVYPVDHLRLSYTPINTHIPAGFWRSVAHSWTTFFIESFIDELAVAAKQSSLAFRQALLEDRPRHLRVINKLAEELKTRDNVGVSIAESHGTVVAHAIEIEARENAFTRVKKVTCVVDCGPVVHPDNVIAQMEGSIVDGLSAALYGEITLKDGQVIQGNFDTYTRMKLADCPEIKVHLIESEQERPGGVGEPAVPGVAPALTGAIFNATGQRIRTLPIL